MNDNQVWIEDFHGKQAAELKASAKKYKVPMEFEVRFQREYEQKQREEEEQEAARRKRRA